MQAPTSFPAVLAPFDHEPLRKKIKECETIKGCLAVYDSSAYQEVMRKVRVAQGDSDVDFWSMDWAVRMRNELPEDVELNDCRKSLLQLLYHVCDLCTDPEIPEETEKDLVNIFKGHRLANVLQLTLPMDRAQCLYKMVYPGSTSYGMIWAAKVHAEHRIHPDSPETRGAAIGAFGGFFTMNKRFLWLLEIESLGLGASPAFRSWTTPQVVPSPVDHQALRKKINQCGTMDDCIATYTSSFYLEVLRLLKAAQSGSDVDAWSKAWAIRMRDEPSKDVELNECRKTALMLVYRICDLWRDPEVHQVTDKELVNGFKGHRFAMILKLTLPMDRAQCLYKMVYPGSSSYGMIWAAKDHALLPTNTGSAKTWGEAVEAAGGTFTMNKRFLWLLGLEGLELNALPELSFWTTPQKIPSSNDQEE